MLNVEKMYTVSETAEMLRKSEITIRQWVQHNKIESVKVGGSRLIPESAIEKKLIGG